MFTMKIISMILCVKVIFYIPEITKASKNSKLKGEKCQRGRSTMLPRTVYHFVLNLSIPRGKVFSIQYLCANRKGTANTQYPK